ncbi:MAG: hypothetical protein ACREQO_14360 [Candidatus Binatia bacterium]
MALKFPWSGNDSHINDPYWDFFINTPPADLTNTVTELIRNAPAGNIFPTRAELHTPEITAGHTKGMARYFGAELIGIAKLDPEAGDNPDHFPFAVVCAVHADQDPKTSPGIGGQVPVQNGLFITFVLSAWIRELGFRAIRVQDLNGEKLAAKAGLGTFNDQGRLVSRELGPNIHVADVIYTDLPLAPDG